MLLAGIFPAKQTQDKVMECSKISSSMIRIHKTPLQTHNYFPAGFQQNIARFYGDVTLVCLVWAVTNAGLLIAGILTKFTSV
jgi:hypothetical protein